jgi:hypothetical protein
MIFPLKLPFGSEITRGVVFFIVVPKKIQTR